MPGDDYLYSLKIPEDHYLGNRPINGLWDFIESQINHFNNYNYRIIPHAALQAVLIFPPIVFDVLNTIVFLLIPAVILKDVPTLKQQKLIWYLLILLFLWGFHFDLGRAYFWTTGSLNYSWILLPQLLFIKGLLKYLKGDTPVVNTFLWVWALFIFMTNEQVVLSLFIATAWLAVWQYKKNKTLPVPLLVSAGILLTGGLLMYYSPSMNFRLEREGFSYENAYFRWIEYFRRVAYYLLRYSPVLLLVLLHSGRSLSLTKPAKFLLCIVGLSLLTMSQAPLFEPRSAIFGFVVFIIAAVHTMKLEKFNHYLLFGLVLLATALFIERMPLFNEVSKNHEQNSLILEANRGSQDTVYLDRFCSSYKYQCLICDDITDDPEYMDNEPLAAYYGIHKLALKPQSSLLYQSQIALNDFRNQNIKHYALAKTDTYDFNGKVKMVNSYYVQNQNTNLAIELSTDSDLSDYIIILRGSRKGINRYRLYDLVPAKWRLYFLDYLEYNAPIISIGKKHYSFHTVFDPRAYSYYLISLYNMNNHAPVGQPIRLELATQD